jgi:hypothetical protein
VRAVVHHDDLDLVAMLDHLQLLQVFHQLRAEAGAGAGAGTVDQHAREWEQRSKQDEGGAISQFLLIARRGTGTTLGVTVRSSRSLARLTMRGVAGRLL